MFNHVGEKITLITNWHTVFVFRANFQVKEATMKSGSPCTFSPSGVDKLCIDTIRFLTIDAVQKANSGHSGKPMGAAPMDIVAK
jgi:hypothetical protein